MSKLRVSIDEEFADTLLDLYRQTVEASNNPPTPEQDKAQADFAESVRKAKRLTMRAADLRRVRAKVSQITGASR